MQVYIFLPEIGADVLLTTTIKHNSSIRMKVASSIKTLKNRHPDCKVVRRKGRLYVINKTNPRFKARQG